MTKQNRTKRPRRRRSVRRPKPTSWFEPYVRMIPKVVKDVNKLRGLINVERHFFINTLAATITTTPTVLSMNDIAAGDDVNNRQGNKILAKFLRGTLTFDLNALATNSWVRVMLVKDRHNNTGTAPAYTDIMNASSVRAVTNIDNTDRFNLLQDDLIHVADVGPFATSIQYKIPLDFHIHFDGTASTDTQENTIYLVVLSTEVTNGPAMNGYLRISYYDN